MIKDKILNYIREKCGYNELQDGYNILDNKFKELNNRYNNFVELSDKKLLELLINNLEDILSEIQNKGTFPTDLLKMKIKIAKKKLDKLELRINNDRSK